MTTNLPENMIAITPAAVNHLKKMLARHKNSAGVRLSVKDAGCSGKKYVMRSVSNNPIQDNNNKNNNNKNKDYYYRIDQDLILYIDSDSLAFLKNIEIDYAKKGLNGQLIYKNPQAKAECGCGESFYV